MKTASLAYAEMAAKRGVIVNPSGGGLAKLDRWVTSRQADIPNPAEYVQAQFDRLPRSTCIKRWGSDIPPLKCFWGSAALARWESAKKVLFSEGLGSETASMNSAEYIVRVGLPPEDFDNMVSMGKMSSLLRSHIVAVCRQGSAPKGVVVPSVLELAAKIVETVDGYRRFYSKKGSTSCDTSMAKFSYSVAQIRKFLSLHCVKDRSLWPSHMFSGLGDILPAPKAFEGIKKLSSPELSSLYNSIFGKAGKAPASLSDIQRMYAIRRIFYAYFCSFGIPSEVEKYKAHAKKYMMSHGKDFPTAASAKSASFKKGTAESKELPDGTVITKMYGNTVSLRNRSVEFLDFVPPIKKRLPLGGFRDEESERIFYLTLEQLAKYAIDIEACTEERADRCIQIAMDTGNCGVARMILGNCIRGHAKR